MTKKKTLVNESVIRRWGKLANMPALTENFLDTAEELEEEEGEEEMEMSMTAAPADDAAEAPAAEQDAVEKIVNAVVDAISQETGVDIEEICSASKFVFEKLGRIPSSRVYNALASKKKRIN